MEPADVDVDEVVDDDDDDDEALGVIIEAVVIGWAALYTLAFGVPIRLELEAFWDLIDKI